MLLLLQSVTSSTDLSNTGGLVASIVTAAVVGIKALSDHRKGKKRPSELGAELERRLKPLHESLDTLGGDVRDLKAYVIGPDGQNGLRGDVRDLKARVDGVEEREREWLERRIGSFDRRSGT